MEKFNKNILKRTQEILLIDKKIKHNGFMIVFERDLKNMLDTYFYMNEDKPKIRLVKGDLGNLNILISLENVKPKKVGINA